MNKARQFPTISVALATHNGCPYLEAQLDSIAGQTIRPDEIIIGDDCSTDESIEVITTFSNRHDTISVRLDVNHERLGAPRNFERIVERCQGDIVVFADQDDIWLPNRLDCIARAFTENPGASYAFSDGLLINSDALPIAGNLFSSQEFAENELDQFKHGAGLSVLLRRNVVIGATLSARRLDLLKILPFEHDWGHDYYIALALEVLGHGIVLEEPLIKYRLHPSQQVGVVPKGIDKWIDKVMKIANKQNESWCYHQALKYREFRNRLMAMGVGLNHPIFTSLEEKACFLDARASMRSHPSRAILLLCQAWWRHDYQKYSLGWKQAVIDVIATLL